MDIYDSNMKTIMALHMQKMKRNLTNKLKGMGKNNEVIERKWKEMKKKKMKKDK